MKKVRLSLALAASSFTALGRVMWSGAINVYAWDRRATAGVLHFHLTVDLEEFAITHVRTQKITG